MPFDGKIGDTAFIVDSGGGHRYVVLTNPNKDGCVVRVNFTSASGHTSDGKVFTSRDNRYFFEVPTIVHYRRAQIYPVTILLKEVNRKDEVSDYRPCPQNIMHQIIKDAFKSQFTKGEVIEELKTQYPKEYEQYYEDAESE